MYGIWYLAMSLDHMNRMEHHVFAFGVFAFGNRVQATTVEYHKDWDEISCSRCLAFFRKNQTWETFLWIERKRVSAQGGRDPHVSRIRNLKRDRSLPPCNLSHIVVNSMHVLHIKRLLNCETIGHHIEITIERKYSVFFRLQVRYIGSNLTIKLAK